MEDRVIVKKLCFGNYIDNKNNIISSNKDLNDIGILVPITFIPFYIVDSENNIVKRDINEIEIEKIKIKKIKEE